MAFYLGTSSKKNLEGVHPVLVECVERAIQITPVDFTILHNGGLRTVEMQRELVAKGASWTMNSKHLPQADGYGHAVDLVPWIGGAPRWEWGPIYHIAAAVNRSAIDVGLTLRWGGVWDRSLSECCNVSDGVSDAMELRAAVHDYCDRHPGRDRIDGPHYEIRSLPL